MEAFDLAWSRLPWCSNDFGRDGRLFPKCRVESGSADDAEDDRCARGGMGMDEDMV